MPTAPRRSRRAPSSPRRYRVRVDKNGAPCWRGEPQIFPPSPYAFLSTSQIRHGRHRVSTRGHRAPQAKPIRLACSSSTTTSPTAKNQAEIDYTEHTIVVFLLGPAIAVEQFASPAAPKLSLGLRAPSRLYKNTLHPSKLGEGVNLHCFKNKIEPKWEDSICANGGKWTISCGEGKSQTLWLHTLLALIGEKFEYGNEILGAVYSVCLRQETIAIWIKDATDEAAQLSIGKQWREFLDYKDSIEFIVDDSGATTVQCWSSTFPDDPLDVIYSKVPNHCSRVRFAAVCRSWCTAASRHPALPGLPWLLLSPRDHDTTKRLYCPEDSKILRISLPSEFVGNWFVGCHDGGWVASFMPPPFRIVNIFSSVEVVLSKKQKGIVCSGRLGQIIIWKIIFSKPPTSSDCILAAITDNHGIALCRVGCPDGVWTTNGRVRYTMELADIAFCNGELYGLTRDRWELVKFEIGVDDDGAPVVTAADRLVVTAEHQHTPSVWSNRVDASYIFELHGKLATAVRSPWSPTLRPFFRVFELVDIDASEGTTHRIYKWAEVTGLGDFALFLGPNCSKAVHVSTDRRGGVKRNHIYYAYHRRLAPKEVLLSSDLVFLSNSNNDDDSVYYREDESFAAAVGGVDSISAVGYYVKGGPNPPMWLLPPGI